MSDGITLGEIVQTLEFFWRIGHDLTAAVMKVYSVLYYGKHEGRTTFRRLAKVSDQMGFLELNTQDEKTVQAFCRLLDSYKVMYSKLPDLNLSDHRCQIAYDASQSQQLQALVNMMSAERLERLRRLKDRYDTGSERYLSEKKKIESELPSVSFIMASDYAMTRLKDGKETSEYRTLEKGAKECIQQELEKNAPRENSGSTATNGEKAQSEQPSTEQKILAVAVAKQLAERRELLASGKAETIPLPSPLEVDRMDIAGKELVTHRLRYPEGKYSVIIPQSHILDEQTILIEKGRTYRVLSNDPFSVKHIKGEQVLIELKSQINNEKARSRECQPQIPVSSHEPVVAKGKKR